MSRARCAEPVSCARAAVRGLSVTIDGRALTAATGGTQTYIIGLIQALARAGEVKVRVLVPHDLSERASNALESVPGVELLAYEQATRDPPRTDVVHRPQQVFTPADLALLEARRRAHRHRSAGPDRLPQPRLPSPTYTPGACTGAPPAWRWPRPTRPSSSPSTLAATRSPRISCRRHGRTSSGWAADASAPTDLPQSPPEGLEASTPFLLCLGADYAHKNRPFAIELLRALRELGWAGAAGAGRRTRPAWLVSGG